MNFIIYKLTRQNNINLTLTVELNRLTSQRWIQKALILIKFNRDNINDK